LPRSGTVKATIVVEDQDQRALALTVMHRWIVPRSVRITTIIQYQGGIGCVVKTARVPPHPSWRLRHAAI
jgi:hypothetical protein